MSEEEIIYFRHLIPQIKDYLRSKGKTPELPLNTLPLLSEKIGGIQKKELTVIGARTSNGKSSFGLQIAYDLALQGHLVLFLSLEMTPVKMGARLFCYQQKFNNTNAWRGGVNDNPEFLDNFEKDTNNLPLIINDSIGKSWKNIDQMIEETDLKPEVVIIDYIQTISSKGTTKLEAIDEYIRHLREMAIRRNFAAIVCSQVNRTSQESDSREPQIHQLKGSGFIEEHADNILLLHYGYKYTNKNINEFTVFISKNKEGATGYIKLNYYPEYYMFKDFEDNKLNIDPRKDKGWDE